MITTVSNRIGIHDPTDAVKQWAKDHLNWPNPEYEKKERMGLWTGKTPKRLILYEWNGNDLILPFGVLRELMPLIREGEIRTAFLQDEVIDYGNTVPLYDYQEKAVTEMLRKKYGTLVSKAGSGKTQCGIAIIQRIQRRALWLCHTKDLLNQSKERAERYIPKGLIGTITEGKTHIGTGVTFATVQTVANLDLDLYRNEWDVVIVDESHRIGSSAKSFTRYEHVLNNLAARHKFGLTATPDRSDGLILATFAIIGNIAYEVPDSAVADRVMKVAVRKIETDTKLTDDCLYEDGTLCFTALIEHLTTDADRNKLIARKIIEEKNHSCIILSDRLNQLEEIRAMLPYEMQEKSAFINGKMTSKKAKAEREEAIEKMRTGEFRYLFASYSLCREGLDVPRMDRLFLASPVKFSSVVIQSVGRIARVFEGKETPVCFDFVDEQIGFCKRAYNERKRHYRKIGCEIQEKGEWLYENRF